MKIVTSLSFQGQCREAFEFNPVQYVRRHRQHGMKTR